MNTEVLAGIKVLVAVAQADGTIHEDERRAIENALEGVELPEGTRATNLLASDVDLDAELALLTSDEARKRCYEAACALVYIDGHVSSEEKDILERIAKAFGIEQEGEAPRFEKFTSALPPPHTEEETDASARGGRLDAETTRAAEFSAVLASWPLPIAAESCLFTNNVQLARNIGVLYGQRGTDEAFWRTFVGNVVGAAAPWFAVSSLLKLVPGSGAAGAYATTYALGQATRLYFDKDEAVDADTLRDAFKSAKKDGQAASKDAKARIAKRKSDVESAKAVLDSDLAAGKLTENAYADKLVALG